MQPLLQQIIRMARVSIVDPYFSSVVALLHFEGTDGSTTFTDQKGKTWTAIADAQIDTARSKFGSSSLLMDGTADAIETASHADFGYGTGDFTVEYFLYINAMAVDVHYTQTSAPELTIYHLSDGTLVFQAGAVTAITTATGVITAGSWKHIALCRVSGTTRLFVDGTQVGSSYTDSNSYVTNTAKFGRGTADATAINGWADELRITKGVGRYAANFTPPTAAFPDS